MRDAGVWNRDERGAFEAGRSLGVSGVQRGEVSLSRRDSGKTQGHPWEQVSFKRLDLEPRWGQESTWEGQASDWTA